MYKKNLRISAILVFLHVMPYAGADWTVGKSVIYRIKFTKKKKKKMKQNEKEKMKKKMKKKERKKNK